MGAADDVYRDSHRRQQALQHRQLCGANRSVRPSERPKPGRSIATSRARSADTSFGPTRPGRVTGQCLASARVTGPDEWVVAVLGPAGLGGPGRPPTHPASVLLHWSEQGTFVVLGVVGSSEVNQRLVIVLADHLRLVPPTT